MFEQIKIELAKRRLERLKDENEKKEELIKLKADIAIEAAKLKQLGKRR